MKSSKFEISELLGIAMTLVVVGIAVAYGLNIMSDVQDDMGENSCALNNATISGNYAGYTSYDASANACTNGTDTVAVTAGDFNATADAVTGVSKIPEKLPTIATVIVAAVILGILVTYLWARFK